MKFRQQLIRRLALAIFAAALALPGFAQSSIEKLKAMKVSGTDATMPLVPQSGPNADAIRANLLRAEDLPEYAVPPPRRVPGARHWELSGEPPRESAANRERHNVKLETHRALRHARDAD